MGNKRFILASMALGFLLMAGCAAPQPSNQPWDKPIHEDNRPGYKSDDSPPLNRDARE